MHKYDLAVELISQPQCEGLKLYPYLCQAGIPTIGIGSTYYPDNKKVTMKDPIITKEQALEYCKSYLQKKVFIKVDFLQIQYGFNDRIYAAICSLLYNIPSAYIGRKFMEAIKSNNINKIAETFKFYNKVTINGILQKSQGLTNRRQFEIDYFLNGNEDWM